MTHLSGYRIGISGWSYPGWRNVFFPEKWPQRRELEFASRQVNSIEINGTFYSLQRPQGYQSWYDAVPDDFIFAVKGGRYITHLRRLHEIEQPVANFFASGILLLRQKLGPILWQFPPNLKYDRDRFERFLSLLPHDTESAANLARKCDKWMKSRSALETDEKRDVLHAIEIRNESFRDQGFYDLLHEHGVALVVADSAGKYPVIEEITAPFVYARMHGLKRLYESGYGDAALDRWAMKLKKWSRDGRCPVFAYFDNDVKVMAPFDAVSLLRRLTDFEPAVPLTRRPSRTKLALRQANKVFGPRVVAADPNDKRWNIATRKRKKAA